MKIAFAIGNGESRRNANLQALRVRTGAKMYGCNALHRDFDPDVLFSVDSESHHEIKYSSFKGLYVFKNNRDQSRARVFKSGELLGEVKVDMPYWNCGAVALSFLCRWEKPNVVFLLGYDLYHPFVGNNNIYKGTSTYKPAYVNMEYNPSWGHCLKEIFNRNPSIQFYRVGREKDPYPREFELCKNIKFISYEEMETML